MQPPGKCTPLPQEAEEAVGWEKVRQAGEKTSSSCYSTELTCLKMKADLIILGPKTPSSRNAVVCPTRMKGFPLREEPGELPAHSLLPLKTALSSQDSTQNSLGSKDSKARC